MSEVSKARTPGRSTTRSSERRQNRVITRIESFVDFFGLDDSARDLVRQKAAAAGERAKGMTHQRDYEALAAVALHLQPRRIFEIGTYLGVTSDFFLQLLPDCTVVSIAYVNPESKGTADRFNNSDLAKEKIGYRVHADRRNRYTQLYGNSHDIVARDLIDQFGSFDLVFIDGDHSRSGVAQDTELARQILTESGSICWHDANPKEKYLEVRLFLEQELALDAIATTDDFTGGIACWSEGIEQQLKKQNRSA
jgi:predicted O-methyltransferase YrrM